MHAKCKSGTLSRERMKCNCSTKGIGHLSLRRFESRFHNQDQEHVDCTG